MFRSKVSRTATLVLVLLTSAVVIAAACTLVEAVSPHGWDNLTMQIVPTAMAWAWLA